MIPYGKQDGDSGVTHYETGPDFIRVKFRDGPTYVYDFTAPGREHVMRMNELARAGSGLSTYISKYVREKYARKE